MDQQPIVFNEEDFERCSECGDKFLKDGSKICLQCQAKDL